MRRKPISCIYAITNLKDGKRYIGSAVDFRRRKDAHLFDLRGGKHKNIHLQRAWDRDGEDSFRIGILSKVNQSEDLLQSEQAWIDSYSPEYNISRTAGSQLGYKHTPETRARLSIIQKNIKRVLTPEGRASVAKANSERIRSPEERARIGAKNRGKPNANKGKNLPKSTCLKISAALRGKKLSEPHKQKLRDAKLRNPVRYWQDKKRSPDTCRKISEAQIGQKRTEEERRKQSVAVTEWWSKRIGNDRKWRKNQ